MVLVFGSRGSRDETRRFKIEITRRDETARPDFPKTETWDETKPRLVSLHYIQKIRIFWCWRIWSFHVFLRFFGRFLVKNSLNLRRDLETRRVSSRAVSVRWSQMRRDWKFQKPRRETRPRRLVFFSRRDETSRPDFVSRSRDDLTEISLVSKHYFQLIFRMATSSLIRFRLQWSPFSTKLSIANGY